VKKLASPCDAALEVTQISLGQFKVGITGLKKAIEEVRALGPRAEAEIAQTLADSLKSQNYIPPSAAEEYKKAFLREFKKSQGEKVEEEAGQVTIRFLCSYCPCSEDFMEVILNVLAKLNLPADVRHVTDAQEIATYKVPGTPALIVNGDIRAVGRMPSQEVLTGWLRDIT
jgi:hypothetical protein